VFVKIFV